MPITYTYVAGGDGAAIWRLLAPTGESVALAAALPPAADAELGVAGVLRPEAVQLATSGRTTTLSFTLELTSRAAAATAPPAVTADDVSVWAGATALPLLDARPTLPLSVAAEGTHLTLTVGVPRDTSVLVVQLRPPTLARGSAGGEVIPMG